MQSKIILETTRLTLREFILEDVHFIIALLNSPNWFEFIGDKGVRTLKDAKNYFNNNLLSSYKKNGFGLWLVQLKDSKIPIGMCGLVNRDSLDDIDIGFAILPDYEGLGYGFEIAKATIDYANYNLKINTIIAITDSNNIKSIKLLEKIGLRFERTLVLTESDSVLVFAPAKYHKDKKEIQELTSSFFDLFTNTDERVPCLKKIHELFIPDGRIINNSKRSPKIYNLDTFIKPRIQILTNGKLTNFCESEVSSKVEIFKNIAHRWSLYTKSGIRDGVYFESRGVKTIQFVKKKEKWKIASIVWSDEN